MTGSKKYNTAQHFETLYKIVSNKRFLNKEGLGGELPFFIHSFPVAKQAEVDKHIQSLIKRLQNEGIELLEVNLYNLCIDIFQKENLLEQILSQESKMPKQRLMRVLSGPLNIDKIVIPEIHRRAALQPYKMIFLTGVGSVYPLIRSHNILNNLQTLVGDLSLVMFFPGTYNNKSLTLFDQLKDDNYYRAHNLNDFKI